MIIAVSRNLICEFVKLKMWLCEMKVDSVKQVRDLLWLPEKTKESSGQNLRNNPKNKEV